MILSRVLSAALVSTAFAQQWLEPPPTTASPDTILDCTWWAVIASGDTCASVSSANSITEAQFRTYNPSTATTCNLVVGNSYCIEQNYGIPPSSTTTTITASATPTGNGVTTPTPIQTGMTDKCKTFHFVVREDTCPAIASRYGISIDDFYAWNPAVGSDCRTMWADTYACVGLISSGATSTGSISTITTRPSATTTRPPATTTTGNGIATPSPILPGMVSNCDLFHLVSDGNTCATISSQRGVSLTDFFRFNPSIPSDCSTGLWLGYYVCVSIVGHSPITSTTTSSRTTTRVSTTTGNGIATPTPYLPGMVLNCDLFEMVDAGETCATITTARGVTLSDFLRFNPSISSDCTSGLWAGYYVCVSTVGHSVNTLTTTTTSRRPTTTTRGNGVATPTPIQPGMVTNCRLFEQVDSGETCQTIAAKRGISLANFYAWNTGVGSNCGTLWLGYYTCVGVL